MRKLLILSSVSILLCGCIGGDVSSVKKSKIEGWPQYTVGQLLEKRQACSSVNWRSFSDSRNRKVVEYVCEYAPAKVFLQKVTDEQLEYYAREKLANEEYETGALVQKRKALEEAMTSHQELLAKKEDLEKNGTKSLREAMRQREIARATGSCAKIDPAEFTHQDVHYHAKAALAACGTRDQASKVSQFMSTIDWLVRTQEETLKRHLEELPRDILNSESLLKDRQGELDELLAKTEKAANEPDLRAKDKQRLKMRLADLEGVKEISHWAIIDDEPTYIGSQVHALFIDQTIEAPVPASFVFKQAADNPEGMSPLYEFLLREMFGKFKERSAG